MLINVKKTHHAYGLFGAVLIKSVDNKIVPAAVYKRTLEPLRARLLSGGKLGVKMLCKRLIAAPCYNSRNIASFCFADT